MYKIRLNKADEHGRTYETDYYNFSKDDAIADFCNYYCNCKPDDINVTELAEFGDIDLEHRIKLYRDFDSIATEFARACKENNMDYDDQDEWIEWLNGYESNDISYHELRFIKTLWTEETKDYYRQRG